MDNVTIATTPLEIESCWEAVSVLRPNLKQENFVDTVRAMQEEGYRLLYITENGRTVAIAGYRIFTMLYCGKLLYIDDLSTVESHRGKGYASLLLKHIEEIARQAGCLSVQLDSGPSRTTAHKLYFKEDFTISAFHFHKSM